LERLSERRVPADIRNGVSLMDYSDHIREHMEVVGSDGKHIGTVDHVEGSRLKLTKSDPSSGGVLTT